MPVPLKDIDERGIEGTLGPRLGAIVEVSGQVAWSVFAGFLPFLPPQSKPVNRYTPSSNSR